MRLPENPQEHGTELWRSFDGLLRLLTRLERDDEGAGSLRAAKYVRSFVTDHNEVMLATLDDALSRQGKTFTFFEDLEAPAEVVEPLFEAMVAAPGAQQCKEAAMQLVAELDRWDANNLPDYSLAA